MPQLLCGSRTHIEYFSERFPVVLKDALHNIEEIGTDEIGREVKVTSIKDRVTDTIGVSA